MLDQSFVILAGGKTLVIKILVHFSHEVIMPSGKADNQSLAFPLSEKGNKCSLTALGSTSFMHIISRILVNVLNCKAEFSTDEP
jgi:hypothetical protein